MKKNIVLLLISIVVLFFLNHCSSGDVCTEPTESFSSLKFYTYSNSIVSDTSVYELTLSGTPPPDTNVLIYNKARNVKGIELPLDHTRDYCSFDLTFSIPDTVFFDNDSISVSYPNYNDRITLYYERILQLISPVCGFGYYYNIDSILHSTTIIESIEIINPVLTPENYGDIKIFI